LQKGIHLTKIMRIVLEKLSGRHWPPKKPAIFDASSLAVLSARLLLDLSPATPKTREYEDEMVRANLRILYSVHENRGTMVTGSSPEPLIAEAAAEIMHHELADKKPYMDVWGTLTWFVNDGLLPQGTIGELLGRYISILAMDHHINGTKDHTQLKFQTPVKVVDYYKALLTEDAWEILRYSVPANRADLSEKSAQKTFEHAFADAYLHFSHYGRANDISPMQVTCGWAHWLRGTAILCQLNQELPDRALPIYFPEHGKVSPQSMSVILEQDKAGQSADPTYIGIQSAEVLGVFLRGKPRPYIAAVHCYALRTNEGITATTSHSRNLRCQALDVNAPRYQIEFRGLAPYRGLTEARKNDIRSMIDGSKNALFNHHPRQYGLPLLRRMQPLLAGDPDATAWFGGPSLGEQQMPDMET
jgi:hypothetical protein